MLKTPLCDRFGIEVPIILAPIIEGRAPVGPLADAEILLGSETLRDIHAKVGSIVEVRIAGTPAIMKMRVVGRAVFPPLSDTTGLGKGALITYDALTRLFPAAAAALRRTPRAVFQSSRMPSTLA